MRLNAKKRILAGYLAVAMALLPVMAPGGQMLKAQTDTESVATLTLNKTELEMKKGKSSKLSVSGTAAGVVWTSSNKKVAAVSAKGVVKAKKKGTAKIKASCNGAVLTCKVTVYSGLTPSVVQKKILALKGKYKEGMSWTNDNHYFWKAASCQCYGCIAFAGLVSDKVFGKKKPLTRHKKFAKIQPGDHVRIGNYHSVIVIKRVKNSLTVVEGNFNSSIHWGRVITKSSLKKEGFYVETRY